VKVKREPVVVVFYLVFMPGDLPGRNFN